VIFNVLLIGNGNRFVGIVRLLSVFPQIRRMLVDIRVSAYKGFNLDFRSHVSSYKSSQKER
jgi:hypothetical protein